MSATHRLGAVLLGCVLAAALVGHGRDDARAHGSRQLDGAWTAVSAERDGKPADELRGHRLTFAGDTFVIRRADGTVLYRGTYRVDPAKKPAHIDFRHTEGQLRGKTWLGIYVLDGASLRITDNAVDMSKPRPSSLAAGADSGYVAFVFKRA